MAPDDITDNRTEVKKEQDYVEAKTTLQQTIITFVSILEIDKRNITEELRETINAALESRNIKDIKL